jgi:protein-L-isoaspartate O-methyltransferase
MIRTALVVGMFVAGACTTVLAQPNPGYGDEVYQPSMGQSGKDVVWVPTPEALVIRMLTAAKVTKDDLVYDLGAGEGRIPIAAAKQFGARAVGIEYNADMAELARRNTRRAGRRGQGEYHHRRHLPGGLLPRHRRHDVSAA